MVTDTTAARRAAWTAGLLLVALWLATHPYHGIVHDSRLYTAQALAALYPARFAGDLFLAFGSQDQFTLFTPIYRPFLAALGKARGNMLLLVIVEALWLGGVTYLAGALVADRRARLVGMALVIVLPGALLLRHGEAFLTPRLPAEALVCVALGLMLRGRLAWAVVAVALAMLVHPLTALSGLALVLLYGAPRRPIVWAMAGGMVAAALGLAVGGVDPFVRGLQQFDPEWLAIVRQRDSNCFMTELPVERYFALATMLALAGIALACGDAKARRLVAMMLAITLLSLVVSLVGGDLFHNVLIVDIQLWRATWLLGVIAYLGVGAALMRPDGGLTGFGKLLVATAVALSSLSQYFAPLVFVAAPFAALAGVVALWEWHYEAPVPSLLRAVALAGLITALSLGCYGIFVGSTALTISADRTLAPTLALITGILAALWFAVRQTRARTSILIGGALLLAAGVAWDQRTPWRAFVDATPAAPVSLTALLTNPAPMYWDGDMTVPWLLLNRASYYSCEQGAGVLFSRATALQYRHRTGSFRQAQSLDFGALSFCPAIAPKAAPTAADLATLCGHEPGLGNVVLTRDIPGAGGKLWRAPVQFDDVRTIGNKRRRLLTDRFFVYDCAGLRN